MKDDWPFSNELGPTGDWPGGKRYGVERFAEMKARTWTNEERRLAAALGWDLPDVDRRHSETWWDQPRFRTVELVYDAEAVTIGAYEPVGPTYEQRVVTARKWGRGWWETPGPLDHRKARKAWRPQ